MSTSITKIDKRYRYVAQVISELPSHCLINKGITDYGGTIIKQSY